MSFFQATFMLFWFVFYNVRPHISVQFAIAVDLYVSLSKLVFKTLFSEENIITWCWLLCHSYRPLNYFQDSISRRAHLSSMDTLSKSISNWKMEHLSWRVPVNNLIRVGHWPAKYQPVSFSCIDTWRIPNLNVSANPHPRINIRHLVIKTFQTPS